MKSLLKTLLLSLATAFLYAPPAFAQRIKTDFGGSQSPYEAVVVIEGADFETSQNLDIALPANFKYSVQSVKTVVRTAPSAVTTPARLSLASLSGATATTIRGSVPCLSASAGALASPTLLHRSTRARAPTLSPMFPMARPNRKSITPIRVRSLRSRAETRFVSPLPEAPSPAPTFATSS